MRKSKQALSRNDLRVLGELALTPGRVVPVDVLLSVMSDGFDGTDLQQRKRLAARVGWIRGAFGHDLITTHRQGRKLAGYAIDASVVRQVCHD